MAYAVNVQHMVMDTLYTGKSARVKLEGPLTVIFLKCNVTAGTLPALNPLLGSISSIKPLCTLFLKIHVTKMLNYKSRKNYKEIRKKQTPANVFPNYVQNISKKTGQNNHYINQQ